jgi:hypothetical protein
VCRPKGFFFGTFCFDQDIQRKKYTALEAGLLLQGGFFCCFALTPLPQRKAVDFWRFSKIFCYHLDF